MRKTKRLLAIILVWALVFSLMPNVASEVKAETQSPVAVASNVSLEGANTSRNLTVDTNGIIYITYKNTSDGKAYVAKSLDGGKTFSEGVKVSDNVAYECEIVSSTNGNIYVAYVNIQSSQQEPQPEDYEDKWDYEDAYYEWLASCSFELYVAYSNDKAASFKSVKVADIGMSIAESLSAHIATDGDHVYAVSAGGDKFYRSADGGKTWQFTDSGEAYAFSDILIDKTTHKITLIKDNPTLEYYVSNDYGQTLNQTQYVTEEGSESGDVPISGYIVYYSTATYGSPYVYISGCDGYLYKINPNLNTIYKIDVPASYMDNGRSISADDKGNLVTGYVSKEGNVCFKASGDKGESWNDEVSVAQANAANAAINPINGDILFLYEVDNTLYLAVEKGYLSGYDVTTDPSVLGFAEADVNSTSRTFNIVNNSNSGITVNSVSATNGFETVFSGTKKVEAGSKTAVSVKYTDANVKSGTITITYNDTKTLTLSLQVFAEVSAPEPEPTPEPTPEPEPTPDEHTHTIVTDAAVAPSCTTTGLTEGSHCSVCGEVITAQTTVPALGHDWSGDWVVTKLATATTDGKKECTCKREGCTQKKYEVIPKIGTPADPNEGKLDKDAEVAPNAPIEEATLDNTKTELLNAPAIFTEEERQAIENGAEARVWMEVSKTDEVSIPSADKTKISDAAKSIMGENPSITYFDADLFKQVGDGAATQLHEPGIDVEVTIKVPANLLNNDNNFEREYKIIRLHTDVATGASLVDILSGTFDKVTGEFTFKTNKFSTYAIAYTDKKLVTGVTLTPETATLTQAGQTVQLTATVAPADATDKSVTWTSSNTNVATVDANGKVTAVANGTAVITVTTTDGNKTAQSTITVAIETTQTPSNSASTKKAVSNRIRLNGGMKFSQTGKQLNLSWGKVSAADGYDVYVQYCGKLFNAKSVTTIKNAKTNKIVIKKINGKSIDPKKIYKAYVVAYKMSNGKKVTLAKSITVHVVGSKHATETNVKSIKLAKDSYTLKKGKTVQVKAKSVLVDSKKKRISDHHGKEFRYTTSNAKVATVTKDGKIKAVGKGTCTIYVYAVNGYAKKITVTVK